MARHEVLGWCALRGLIVDVIWLNDNSGLTTQQRSGVRTFCMLDIFHAAAVDYVGWILYPVQSVFALLMGMIFGSHRVIRFRGYYGVTKERRWPFMKERPLIVLTIGFLQEVTVQLQGKAGKEDRGGQTPPKHFLHNFADGGEVGRAETGGSKGTQTVESPLIYSSI